AEAHPRVGKPLELVVRLTSADKPIDRNARVTVTLVRPKVLERLLAGIKPTELRSFEPGLSIKEQKQLALVQKSERWIALKSKPEQLGMRSNQKGEFRALIQPRVPGIYTAVITVDAGDDRVGRFNRTATAVTVVRSAR